MANYLSLPNTTIRVDLEGKFINFMKGEGFGG